MYYFHHPANTPSIENIFFTFKKEEVEIENNKITASKSLPCSSHLQD